MDREKCRESERERKRERIACICHEPDRKQVMAALEGREGKREEESGGVRRSQEGKQDRRKEGVICIVLIPLFSSSLPYI